MSSVFQYLVRVWSRAEVGTDQRQPVAGRIRLVAPVDLLDGALLEAPADSARGIHLIRQGTSVQ